MIDLDAVDRALLERMQAGVPLVSRPFAALGEALGLDEGEVLGLDEGEVLGRVRRLKEAGLIRQIGAIFDTRRLGYQSTLVAFHMPGAQLESAAAVVSAHPGVSHNYARPHRYNLWFTLAVSPGRDVADEIRRLAAQTGVDDWLNLPALRVFKLKTHFKLGQESPGDGPDSPDRARPANRELGVGEIPFVKVLQRDLPLVPRPFAGAAAELGLDEASLLARARDLELVGILRRFSAVLRHRKAGYKANGMACWVVDESRIEEVGRFAAGFPSVSHCYQRPAYPPRWLYTLFTMIHGQTKAEVEAVVAQIVRETGIGDYEVLYSTREFKKERVRYFEEEET